jgi:peptidoglycan lytic transglycosylase
MQTVPLGAGGAIPRLFLYAAATTAALLLSGLPARADSPLPVPPTTGHASWYGDDFARRPTASGERFDPEKLTGAHRTLPLGSRVRVTNLLNGRSVLVTITDRGPYARRRAIDLSYGAARALGMLRRGVTRVRIELVES